jgi:hypothetical protein
MTRRNRVVASPARAEPPPAHQAIPCNAVGLEEHPCPPRCRPRPRWRSYTSPRTAPRRPRPGVAVIGEVDLATVPELRDRLLGVLHDHNPDLPLDVDLGEVTFLDCAGIDAHRRAQRRSPSWTPDAGHPPAAVRPSDPGGDRAARRPHRPDRPAVAAAHKGRTHDGDRTHPATVTRSAGVMVAA